MVDPDRISIAQLRGGAAQHLRHLSNLPNVLYATIGDKRTGGERTGETAAVAYVLEKADMPSVHRVPRTIDVPGKEGNKTRALRTDVVALPSMPRAFGVRSGHIIQGFDGDIGVCSLAFRKLGQSFLMTNAHVVSNVAWNGSSGRVRLFNRATQAFVPLGMPRYISPLRAGIVATADVALVSIPDEVLVDEMQILDFDQPVSRLAGVRTGADINYWYSVNGTIHQCAFPEAINVAALAHVDQTLVSYTRFWQLQMTLGAAAPGQSGALLCRTVADRIEACGLVFAGVAPTFLWVFPIQPMWALATANI